MAIETLKKRSSFLRVCGGGRWATGAFVLEGKPRVPGNAGEAGALGISAFSDAGRVEPAGGSTAGGIAQPAEVRAHPAGDIGDAAGAIAHPRFGFTVTKKLGNAVSRNRIRRRLKAAVAQVAPLGARADCDYVIIARNAALTRPFLSITQDLDNAFERVHLALRKPGAGGGKSSRKPRTERTKGRDRS